MRFSFRCPHCKRALEADRERAGSMTLCEHCLVAFPIPQSTAASSPPPAIKVQPEPEINILMPDVGSDLGWRLVRLGLSLMGISLIVLLAAGLVAAIAFLSAINGPPIARPLLSPARPFLVLPLFVAVAALVGAFIGPCLCCNAPGDSWLRVRARACVVLILLAGVAEASALAMNSTNDPDFRKGALVLDGIAYIAAGLAAFFWALFIRGVAEAFHNEALAANTLHFLSMGSFFLLLYGCFARLPLILNEVITTDFNHSLIIAVVPAGFLYIWLVVLVSRARRTIPVSLHPRL